MAGVCTGRASVFFFPYKNGTSDRPIALLPTLLRWCERLRAPVVAEWKSRRAVTRYGMLYSRRESGHCCGRRALLDMESFDFEEGQKEEATVSSIVDLAKTFEKSWSCDMALDNLPRFSFQASSSRMREDQDSNIVHRNHYESVANLPGSKWSFLFLGRSNAGGDAEDFPFRPRGKSKGISC